MLEEKNAATPAVKKRAVRFNITVTAMVPQNATDVDSDLVLNLIADTADKVEMLFGVWEVSASTNGAEIIEIN